jgi:hypothetical protein
VVVAVPLVRVMKMAFHEIICMTAVLPLELQAEPSMPCHAAISYKPGRLVQSIRL